MLQLAPKTLATFAFIITLAGAAAGQSTDRDNPTKLTSPEISGFVDGQNARIQYYYSVTAGPGEVVITLDVKAVGEHTSIRYEIFGQDARSIADGSVDSLTAVFKCVRRVSSPTVREGRR